MKIYLTRHGETEWNVEKRKHGHKNANLTKKGIEDAKKLSKRLEDVSFDCIYSSPAPRAIDTAKYIRGNKDTEIITTEYLREINFGKWEGMLEVDAEKLNPEQFYNIWNRPKIYEPTEGGEKFEDVINRVKHWFYDMISNSNKEENILIVTHGVVTRAIFALLKDTKVEDFWNGPEILNTSLTVLEAKDNKISILLEADASHLDEELHTVN